MERRSWRRRVSVTSTRSPCRPSRVRPCVPSSLPRSLAWGVLLLPASVSILPVRNTEDSEPLKVQFYPSPGPIQTFDRFTVKQSVTTDPRSGDVTGMYG